MAPGVAEDLDFHFDTDPWQLSRAGRRLRDLGLADRVRAGRLNTWSLTDAGEQEARQLRGPPPPAANNEPSGPQVGGGLGRASPTAKDLPDRV